MRLGSYQRTMGKLKLPGQDSKTVEIALDSGAEVDVIDTSFAQQQRLKPYIKKYPELWQSAGDTRHQAKGAYWATWEITDS